MPEPMLSSVPDAAMVAAKLSEALTGQPGPSAISLVQNGTTDFASNAIPHSPSTVAA